jgi:hypothetical protein
MFTRILLVRLSCTENNKLMWLRTKSVQLTLKTDFVINCEVQLLLCRSTTCVCVRFWAEKSAFHMLFLLLFSHRRDFHLFHDFHHLYTTPVYNIPVKYQTALRNSAHRAEFAAQNNGLNDSPFVTNTYIGLNSRFYRQYSTVEMYIKSEIETKTKRMHHNVYTSVTCTGILYSYLSHIFVPGLDHSAGLWNYTYKKKKKLKFWFKRKKFKKII